MHALITLVDAINNKHDKAFSTSIIESLLTEASKTKSCTIPEIKGLIVIPSRLLAESVDTIYNPPLDLALNVAKKVIKKQNFPIVICIGIKLLESSIKARDAHSLLPEYIKLISKVSAHEDLQIHKSISKFLYSAVCSIPSNILLQKYTQILEVLDMESKKESSYCTQQFHCKSYARLYSKIISNKVDLDLFLKKKPIEMPKTVKEVIEDIANHFDPQNKESRWLLSDVLTLFVQYSSIMLPETPLHLFMDSLFSFIKKVLLSYSIIIK
jgi:hypothetical protein